MDTTSFPLGRTDPSDQVSTAPGAFHIQLAGELSGLLSRAGFLASFTDALLPDAAEALEEALNGEADGWVTKWNLMNVRARLGDFDAAVHILDEVEQTADGWLGSATILFWVPGRPCRRFNRASN